MTRTSTRRTFGSGDTTQVRLIRPDLDVLLVIDDHEPTLERVRLLSGQLGCELLEACEESELRSVLDLRRISMVFVALDARAITAVAALRLLAHAAPSIPVILVGEVPPRLAASTRRLALEHGLRVAGMLKRPLDADEAERLCMPLLGNPPAVCRAELESALAEHQFCLVYQPKMAIEKSGLRLEGVEAFVRWRNPRRGLLRPAQFLPSLEREEMLAALMDFVIQEAIRQAGDWRQQGLALQVSVNLSPRLVKDHQFPERLTRLLREHDVPPELIAIDLTEDTEGERALVLEVFTALRLSGISLSLDNFGTGYSSLTELCHMPFTEVKIDGSLIAEVPHEREASIIVRAIVDLAHTLGLRACAEGVERREAVEFLREIGCDSLQGRVVCGPVGAAEIRARAGAFGRD